MLNCWWTEERKQVTEYIVNIEHNSAGYVFYEHLVCSVPKLGTSAVCVSILYLVSRVETLLFPPTFYCDWWSSSCPPHNRNDWMIIRALIRCSKLCVLCSVVLCVNIRLFFSFSVLVYRSIQLSAFVAGSIAEWAICLCVVVLVVTLLMWQFSDLWTLTLSRKRMLSAYMLTFGCKNSDIPAERNTVSWQQLY